MFNKINSRIIQVDESDYYVKNELGTSFLVDIDKQICQCGKPNCKHLQYLNSKIYKNIKKRMI